MKNIIYFESGLKPVIKFNPNHDEKGQFSSGPNDGTVIDSMPYKLNPNFKKPISYKKNLSSEEYLLGNKQLQEVAKSPIVIKVQGEKLRKIVEDGRFKSLDELPPPTDPYSKKYIEGRNDLEKGLWGLPQNAHSPIYGFFNSPLQPSVHNQTDHYGDVTITLKDEVAKRATITAGDSANHGLIPVLVIDARKKNLSNQQVDGAYRSRAFQKGSELVSQVINSVRSIKDIDYFEAQIHGGVTLKDIKSVRLKRYSIVDSATIASLEANGIEVIRSNDNN